MVKVSSIIINKLYISVDIDFCIYFIVVMIVLLYYITNGTEQLNVKSSILFTLYFILLYILYYMYFGFLELSSNFYVFI